MFSLEIAALIEYKECNLVCNTFRLQRQLLDELSYVKTKGHVVAVNSTVQMRFKVVTPLLRKRVLSLTVNPSQAEFSQKFRNEV